MNYRSIFFMVISMLTLLSCDPLTKIPMPNNIETAKNKFYSDTLTQKYTKDQYEAFKILTSLLSDKTETEIFIKHDINNMKYDSVINMLTNFFEANSINYYDLLEEAPSFSKILEEKESTLKEVRQKIQNECKKRQSEVDRISKILTESMTSTVTGPYTGYSQANGSYVEFKIINKNHTTRPISGRKTYIEFYDGFNKIVHAVNLRGNNKFRKSDIGYLRYHKNDDVENYKKFADLKAGSFLIKTTNKVLNIGGNLTEYPKYTNINYNRKSFPSSTYCPYLEYSKVTESLLSEVQEIEQKYKNKMDKNCKGLSKMMFEYLPLLTSR